MSDLRSVSEILKADTEWLYGWLFVEDEGSQTEGMNQSLAVVSPEYFSNTPVSAMCLNWFIFWLGSLQSSCLCFHVQCQGSFQAPCILFLCFALCSHFASGRFGVFIPRRGHVGTKLRKTSYVKLQALCGFFWAADWVESRVGKLPTNIKKASKFYFCGLPDITGSLFDFFNSPKFMLKVVLWLCWWRWF